MIFRKRKVEFPRVQSWSVSRNDRAGILNYEFHFSCGSIHHLAFFYRNGAIYLRQPCYKCLDREAGTCSQCTIPNTYVNAGYRSTPLLQAQPFLERLLEKHLDPLTASVEASLWMEALDKEIANHVPWLLRQYNVLHGKLNRSSELSVKRAKQAKKRGKTIRGW